MVDDLTNESFQTGKAVVTVSVDLITAIAEACRESEKNKELTGEQKESLVKKVTDKVATNYKETHGSLKSFNRDDKDVTHIDVGDEKTAKILEKTCKKAHVPVVMKTVSRADGSNTFTAFCEVKNMDQIAGLLKNATEQVLEEQRAMTKTLSLNNEKGEAVFSQEFVKDSDLDVKSIEKAGEVAVSFEIKDSKKETLAKGTLEADVKMQIKKEAKEHNPKKEKSLKERIAEKKEQSQNNQKDKNRQREKSKKKTRENSR